MGKLKRLSGRQVCKILEKHGFSQVRQKGSHIVMQLKKEKTTVTVLVPDHREIKTGTLMSIIRQSQLPRSAFE